MFALFDAKMASSSAESKLRNTRIEAVRNLSAQCLSPSRPLHIRHAQQLIAPLLNHKQQKISEAAPRPERPHRPTPTAAAATPGPSGARTAPAGRAAPRREFPRAVTARQHHSKHHGQHETSAAGNLAADPVKEGDM